MAVGVIKSSQMTLKMSGRKTRRVNYYMGTPKILREDTSWLKQAPGSGLDEYILDLMKLN